MILLKKRIVSALAAFLLIVSSVSAFAAETRIVEPRASDYLDGAYITLTSQGSRQMTLGYAIYGTKLMSKIGVTKIEVEEYDGFEWHFYTSFTSSYTYNDDTHADTVYFEGHPGCEYRAVLYAYAKNSSGSDSRKYTGSGVVCK